MKQIATRYLAAACLLMVGAALPYATRQVWPAPPSVQFLGPTGHTTMRDGDPLRVFYADVLRTELCSLEITVRWRDVDATGEAGAVVVGIGGETYVATPANMSDGPVDFPARLDSVKPPPVGDWFYAPLGKPGPECANRDVIVIPPHRVTVLPAEKETP